MNVFIYIDALHQPRWRIARLPAPPSCARAAQVLAARSRLRARIYPVPLIHVCGLMCVRVCATVCVCVWERASNPSQHG